MYNDSSLEVKVWGPLACFTRPEMKVERVTYPVMTPSAARGVLEAIFWKPEFDWIIKEIHVLAPIRHFSILRNEVTTKVSPSVVQGWQDGGGHFYAEDSRAQRHTLALRDVSYLIRADVRLRPHADNDPAKYRAIFRRRVNNGQAHHQPYLGCREFSCHFAPADGSERAVDLTDDLGRILFDLRYDTQNLGHADPVFFNARIEKGVLRVPAKLYERGQVSVS